MNERYDAFVLPLANVFRPQFENQLRQYAALVRQLKIPCVVVGIGLQAGLDLAELKSSSFDHAAREFVTAILDKSATIGVRGEFTRDYLVRLGFSAIDVIGCPSMYFNGANLYIRKASPLLDFCDNIAVNHDIAAKREIGGLVRNVLDTHPCSIFVAQQEADVRSWTQVVARSKLAGSTTARRIQYFKDVPPWIRFMRTRAFSMGTRIHGNIAAILAGVPAVVIAHDSRTLELAKDHKIPYVLENTITETARIAELYEAADFGPFNASVSGQFDRYKAFLEKNGLKHAYNDPQYAAVFEERMAAMAFPDRLSA